MVESEQQECWTPPWIQHNVAVAPAPSSPPAALHKPRSFYGARSRLQPYQECFSTGQAQTCLAIAMQTGLSLRRVHRAVRGLVSLGVMEQLPLRQGRSRQYRVPGGGPIIERVAASRDKTQAVSLFKASAILAYIECARMPVCELRIGRTLGLRRMAVNRAVRFLLSAGRIMAAPIPGMRRRTFISTRQDLQFQWRERWPIR